jgi:multiple sugar transport system substrate-binding protein
VKTATWQGKLYAAPINSNTQLLWYRKDLVPTPPKTWTQMINDAISLAKQGKPHYIEEQGAKYEGLTVWFNSLVNSAGGGILTPQNKIIVGPSTATAAAIMRRLADSPAADPGLNVAQEAQSETAWEHGTAAFQINYPFVYSAAQKDSPSVFKHMGYAAFPSVIPGVAPKVSIGGYNLGVSAHSQHPQLAFAAVRCLVQPANQVRDAIKGGLAPVLGNIYDEPSFAKAYPFHALIKAQLENYGLRPQTPAYADVTQAIQNAFSPTSGIQTGSVVSTLRSEIKNALTSEALL